VEEREVTYYYDNMYRALSTLHAYGAATSKRTFGLSVPADGANLFLLPGFMIEDVEQLRTVRDYRTPRGFYQAPAPPPHSVSSARLCAACRPRWRPARRRAEWAGAGAQASDPPPKPLRGAGGARARWGRVQTRT